MNGFRAHLGGVPATGFAPFNYTQLVLPALAYGEASEYALGAWQPPVGPVTVMIAGQVWVSQGGYGSPPNYVAKVIKNGYPGVALFAGIGVPGSFPGSFVIPFCGTDLAQLGDTYRVYLYATNGACVVDGNPAHTWWCGAVL